MWLDRVKNEIDSNVDIAWRSFSLEQQNSKEGDDWKVWEQGEDFESRGMLAHRAGVAARNQDGDLTDRFVLALLTARHVDLIDLRDRDAILKVARDTGLDMERFEADLDSGETLNTIAGDHEEAATEGIFGTPTYVFPDAKPAFLKMFAPDQDKAADVWNGVRALSESTLGFGELKRPQPPWPKNIF